MTELQYIQAQLSLPEKSILKTIQLLNEDCTIPFISRYRKEMTGNLDEVQIGQIVKLKAAYSELEKRRQAILKAITEQDALTPQLQDKIAQAKTVTVLEDIYLPYKKKRKTKASIAKENGLESLAKIIMKQQHEDVNHAAQRFIKGEVSSTEKALEGARHIIAEWINENEYVRNNIRRLYQRKATITTKVVKAKIADETAQKYKQYFDWSESLQRAPSHRLLAMLRAENEGFIKLKVEVDKEEALNSIHRPVIKTDIKSCTDQVSMAIEDAYKRLLSPGIINEVMNDVKSKADTMAISVFAENLKQLLLGAPLGQKRVLALDPGFKSGCKVVCLDEKGDLLHNENIYPHPPQRETTQASKKIKSLVNAYKIEAIAIGNGTASRETEFFIKKIQFDRDLLVFIVNEAGASVYSASKIARAEFPNYDVTVRGAVSIGRRLTDPLAELVKIDPKSIGVGQYQHDVDQTKLKEELDIVVMSCVNAVGVNVNTASSALLSYVSGIGTNLAENVVKFRTENGEIDSRNSLKNVPRLGPKAFQQAAAFLRIRDAKHPLDNSTVHPESYHIVEKMAKDAKISVDELIGNKEVLSNIKLSSYCTETIGLPTLSDIVKELEKPGVDPRKAAKLFEFDPTVKKISDVKVGMSLPGIVNNITNFGCFVDIGIKESGLVHISKLANEFISDVNSVVKLHQHVTVTVVEVDEARKRIQLSMID
jgi:uncharacterized protein